MEPNNTQQPMATKAVQNPPLNPADFELVNFTFNSPENVSALSDLVPQQAEQHHVHFPPSLLGPLTEAFVAQRCNAILCFHKPTNEPVGLVTFTDDISAGGASYHFEDLVVDKRWRNQNLGRFLMAEFLRRAKASGKKGIKLYTSVKNAPAHAVFSQFKQDVRFNKFIAPDFSNLRNSGFSSVLPPVMEFPSPDLRVSIPDGSSRPIEIGRDTVNEFFLLLDKNLGWKDVRTLSEIANSSQNDAMDVARAQQRELNHISLMSSDGAGATGVVIAYRGYSTLQCLTTSHISLLAFRNEQTIRQDMPKLMQAALDVQKRRGWQGPTYVDVADHKPEMQTLLLEELHRLGAEPLKYGDEYMVAFSLYGGQLDDAIARADQLGWTLPTRPDSHLMHGGKGASLILRGASVAA